MPDQTDADRMLDAFDEFARAVRRARGASTGAAPLSLSQYGLLEPLLEAKRARIGELAEAAGITASTATRILDALERREIVSRVRSSTDRRAVAVQLTPAGRALLRRHRGWVQARELEFSASLSPEELTLAPALLRKLAELIGTLAAGGPAL